MPLHEVQKTHQLTTIEQKKKKNQKKVKYI